MLDDYLSGAKLYGDDFDVADVKRWYDEEAEGYADLVKRNADYRYVYHALDQFYGYRHTILRSSSSALGVGSAFGDELLPVIDTLSDIVILEPSKWLADHTKLERATYLTPNVTGEIDLPTDTFDLITCLGVLHHIPNVSFVLGELYRCLRRGGYMLLREPIVSQGDWTIPRPGLTKNERGIPLAILDKMLESTGFQTVARNLWDFSPLARLCKMVRVETYNSYLIVLLDRLMSRLFGLNTRYHRVLMRHKFGPAAAYYVLTKT